MVVLSNNTTVLLLNDAGTGWVGGYAVGSNNTAENSYCKVEPLTTAVTFISANTMQFRYDVTFKSALNGVRPVYGIGADANWSSSEGWKAYGTFSVNGAAPPAGFPQVTSASATYNNGAISYSVTANAPKGITDMANLILAVGPNVAGNPADSCYSLLLNRTTVLLLNNDATIWLGWFAAGSTGLADNNHCTINGTTTSVSVSGNSATFSGQMIVKAPMAGTPTIYALATDANWSSAAGWVTFGSMTIPVGGGNTTVKVSSGVSFAKPSTSMAYDNFLGGIFPMPSIVAPKPHLNLTTVSGNRVVKVGEAVQIEISNASPNTAVWGVEMMPEYSIQNPDGSSHPVTLHIPPNASGSTSIQTVQELDSYFIGAAWAWPIGTTDAAGHFSMSVAVPNVLAAHRISLFVQNYPITSSPPDPQQISDSGLVGSMLFWATNAAGSPAFPGMAAIQN
jgi:hypothetical protein